MERKRNTKALYEIIQQDIIEKIQLGEYKTGDKIPSEKELMKDYQVSRITATKALTELSLSGYINRIQGKGSFVNELVSHLPKRKGFQNPSSISVTEHTMPYHIGLIIPEHFDYHSGNIIKGVMDSLPFPDFFVDIVLNRNESIEEYALNTFTKFDYSGIILFPSDYEFYSDIILQMHLNNFPLILIDRPFPGISCNSVICNNEYGTSLAVEHLVSLGHQNIAFVSDASYKEQITATRYNSYIKSMLSHNLTVLSYENFSHNYSNDHTASFLDNVTSGKITAIIASNSHVALKIYHLCLEHNIDVPSQLSIVCFDNPNYIVDSKNDFFTYIDQSSYLMGQQAGFLVKQMITEPGRIENQKIILDPKLIINHSTQKRL